MDQPKASSRPYCPLGFPVSQEAWSRIGLDDLAADAAALDEHARIPLMRQLAYRLQKAKPPEEAAKYPARPGHLQAFALLHEILRYVFNLYCREQNKGALGQTLAQIRARFGQEQAARQIEAFVALYPPPEVRQGAEVADAFLAGETDGAPHVEAAAREASLLRVATENPALRPFRELFNDEPLEAQSAYRMFTDRMDGIFREQPAIYPIEQALPDCLRAPIAAAPESLEGQLEYIREHWAALLPPWLLQRLLAVRDALREETQMRGFGPPLLEVMGFGKGLGGFYGYPEPERFTPDADWMSRVVLIAKIAYVWLHQLSKQYQRPIARLDEIPDAELDRLARYGFTGLWLIGLWERSSASEDIKKRMGNPEAAASAYSLYDYTIAWELGGEEAYLNLKARAWQRGIRLASDMVPNHVGIHSKWVIEHPDWFVQTSYPPFPSYQFNGPDLCPDDRVGLYIEDGYWSHSDAAVVFKRVDHWTGDTRYIYHGNDGTNMPWNDTAQLNYLIPEVREAVIQTILHVARLSPIIRFDAAMTLAKKHFQRLWFPLPGEGGAIPSRSQCSMTKEAFDAVFPEEFWRQVVDRVQEEVPDTLLLAEAFWLMEGYFVRTLGMHRVYNSAFMNMLKMEENLKYRMTVKNVLEFSPEVLKRFVNFMNNPDEMTAVEQFGNGDKYFGVAMMMATMPGLPMFGHGQIEGFTEKYGMEYRRAYWDETVNDEMVRRHEREVFPLMRRRYLFSGVEQFAFYDFIHPDAYVDENVFAYSNRAGGERSIVIYNNSYNSTRGRLHTSTAFNQGSVEVKDLVHRTLVQSLGLRTEPGVFYIFRDHHENLEYIRSGRSLAEDGLYLELRGYQYHVMMDFEEVIDTAHVWAEVAARLGGGGVPNIRRFYKEILVAPMLDAFSNVAGVEMLRQLVSAMGDKTKADAACRRFGKVLGLYLDITEAEVGVTVEKEKILGAAMEEMAALLQFEKRLEATAPRKAEADVVFAHMPEQREDGLLFWRIPIIWTMVHHLEEVLAVHSGAGSRGHWLDEWLLTDPIIKSFSALGIDEWRARDDTRLMMLLTSHTKGLLALFETEPALLVEEMLDDPIVREFLRVNEYQGITYLNKEQLERAMGWLLFTAALSILSDSELTGKQRSALLASRQQCVERIMDAAVESGYQTVIMLELLSSQIGPICPICQIGPISPISQS